MTVFGVSMVRDEEDILPYTLSRMAAQLDGILIADNLSTDGTRVILEKVAAEFGNIEVFLDPDPAYMQSQKMTQLAQWAGDRGARWIVPFDADEVWVSESGLLRDVLRDSDAGVIEATLFDHVVTGLDDSSQPDPVKRIAFRRDYPGALPKVAASVLPGLVIEQGNHGAHYPGHLPHFPSDIVVHHYPYRSVEQMARKARNGAEAYAAAGDRLPDSVGRHWREYGRHLEERGIEAIREIFETWFYSKDAEGLVVDVP